MFTFFEKDLRDDGTPYVKVTQNLTMLEIIGRIADEHYVDGLTPFVVVMNPDNAAGASAIAFIETSF